MPTSPPAPPQPPRRDAEGLSKPEAGTVEAGPATEPSRAGGYFGVPDPGEKPLGFARLMVILMSGHIGVRSRVNREEDFRRANGLHVFVAAIIYFLLVVGVLILVVTATTS